MKKVGVRVVSAALAACMMTSILPVSAFAAVGMDDESGIVAAETENVVKDGDKITEGGTYSLSGTYKKCIIIDTFESTNKDVILNITGPVTFAPEDSSNTILIRVPHAGSLTINAAGQTIDAGNYTVLSDNDVRDGFNVTGDLTINGGTYMGSNVFALKVAAGQTATLKDVTATGSNYAVCNNGAGTVIITGGKYTGTSATNAALDNVLGTMEINTTVSAVKTAVSNRAQGTIKINGGTYTSETGVTVNSADAGSIANIYGGSIKCESGDGTAVLNNGGTMTIDEQDGSTTLIEGTDAKEGVVINCGNLTLKNGTIDAHYNGTGLKTVADGTAATTITGGTIQNCTSGISMQQSGETSVTLNDVTLNNNTYDIVLSFDQQITIADTFTKETTIRVFDPVEGRQLTKGINADKLNLVSKNSGYSVVYNTDHYELHLNALHKLFYEHVKTAQKTTDKVDSSGNDIIENAENGGNVLAGAKVTLIPEENPGYRVTGWTLTLGTELTEDELTAAGLTEQDLKSAVLEFTMPDCDVTLAPKYEFGEPDPIDPTPVVDPTDPDDSGDDAIKGALSAVVVGAAAGAIIYETGTGIYRMVNMPGIILPSDRIELAELIWEKAGKPEPESTELYSDIDEDDTDWQKAARWAVEQELMRDDEDNNEFHPYFPVSKLRVCLTWQNAKDKGLID